MSLEGPIHRKIKSFVKREGRLTPAQQRALDELWELYGISYDAQRIDFESTFGNSSPTTLEIGFGNGQSLAQMAETAPDENFLGIEVHRPGVGLLLATLEEKGIKKCSCDAA